MTRISAFFFVAGLTALPVHAEEAQVTQTVTEGTPEFYESISAFSGETRISIVTVRVPMEVTYTRVAGDALTRNDLEELWATAFICGGPDVLNKQGRFDDDKIVFTFDCIRPEK